MIKHNNQYSKQEKAVLLLHGYLSNHTEMILLEKTLKEKGFYVVNPDLKGHGTDYIDLDAVKIKDWLGQINFLYENLKNKFRQIFIIGFSFGGLLALYLGIKFKEINGVVLINHLYKLPFSIKLCLIIKNFIKYFPNITSDIKNKKMIRKHFLYNKISIQNCTEVIKLKNYIAKYIHRFKNPILIFKSKNDHRVPFKSALLTYNSVSSINKKLIYLYNSYHAAMLDFDKDRIINEIFKFINKPIYKDSNAILV